MGRWYLILNGKSANEESVRRAVKTWRKRGVDLQVRVTWESGDAARYATEAVAGHADCVIAGGGDGTVGEVASALARRTEPADALPALAVMPLGTANDFATAVGVPESPADALQLIHEQPPVKIDLLRVEARDDVRWCINVASGGFGTQITIETDEGLKKMLGGLAYLVTGLARVGRIQPLSATLESDDLQWQGEFIALGVGNGRQAGGGQALCPDALIDDGLLDVTVIPELREALGDALGALVKGGTRGALERVAVRGRLPRLSIDTMSPMTLNLDGEPMSSTHFRIECVPARLRMHLPAGCPLISVAGTTETSG